jgi:branched-subunit amino acid aminotransferase/4-amino-4-deoxychorismate lyase
MQLVISALDRHGTPSRRSTVRIADLSSFQAVFVTNSLGVAPVGQVDDQVLTVDPDFIRDLAKAYDSVPWDRI